MAVTGRLAAAIQPKGMVWLGIAGAVLAGCGGQAHQPGADATPAASSSACASNPPGQQAFAIVPEQSQASYAVHEKIFSEQLQRVLGLLGQDNTAVGKSNAVSGTMQFIRTDTAPTLKTANITVDLRALTSNNQMRDNRIRDNWLESNRYPYAAFTARDAQVLPRPYSSGEEITFSIPGEMTIHNTTRPLVFQVKASLTGSLLKGTATASLLMKDYGVEPPNLLGLLTVQDGVGVTVAFTAAPTACAPAA